MKNKSKIIISVIITFIITISITVTASIVMNATDISFTSDKTDKTNVNDSLDELYDKVGKCPDGKVCFDKDLYLKYEGNHPKCKRATYLHTEICNLELEGWGGCRKNGYAYGDTITYGNKNVTNGLLNAGDAFTCDVNGDGIYDEETERFYYVSDYYNTKNKTFESDTAVLIYYNNTINGLPNGNDARVVSYDSSNESFHGPRTAMLHLPTTEQWSNVTLKNTERAILTYYGGTYTSSGTLPTAFSYAGRAARLLTYFEMSSLCGTSPFSKCEFFGENTRYSASTTYGALLENPAYQSTKGEDLIVVISGANVEIAYFFPKYTIVGARPVIEVQKLDIDY